MNRRTFFKTVAATVAGAIAVGVAPRVVGAKVVVANSMDRSVVWGEAYMDAPEGDVFVCWAHPRWNYGDALYMIQVQVTEPIKEGDALVWNPDGTVRCVTGPELIRKIMRERSK